MLFATQDALPDFVANFDRTVLNGVNRAGQEDDKVTMMKAKQCSHRVAAAVSGSSSADAMVIWAAYDTLERQARVVVAFTPRLPLGFHQS